MVKLVIYIAILFHLVSLAQTDPTLEIKNKELNQLQENISKLEQELNSLKLTESKSRDILIKLDQENLLLSRSISNLVIQEKIKTLEITNLTDSIRQLDTNLFNLRKEYAKYIKWLFMYGKDSKLKILFGSGSLNQALLRYKHFNYLSERSTDLNDELTNSKFVWGKLKEKLEYDHKYQKRVIEEKQSQVNRLASKRKEKEDLIDELRQDEANLEMEIDEKRKAEILIKNLITKLEEEERERERKRMEDRLRGIERSDILTYNYERFENFEELRGKLNWPVSNGRIIRAFGENTNKRLKTVTLNYGVDIASKKNTFVHSVAEGVISAIEWIPGFGSVVIVTHKGRYRTVYGHLTDIEVDENQKVRGGDVLGKVNQSLEGNIIHFEVWNERNYQNPEIWLTRK